MLKLRLHNMVMSSHIWLFKVKQNLKVSSSDPATSHGPMSPWLVVAVSGQCRRRAFLATQGVLLDSTVLRNITTRWRLGIVSCLLCFSGLSLWKKYDVLHMSLESLTHVNPGINLSGSYLSHPQITTKTPNKKQENLASSVWETSLRYLWQTYCSIFFSYCIKKLSFTLSGGDNVAHSEKPRE